MHLTQGITREKKRQKKTCLVAFCQNHVFVGRNGNKSSYCPKHRRERQKETDPIGYHFDILRQNAKRRGIPFSLTKHEFAIFCAETDYLRLKGRFKTCLSIDRINSDLGYQAGNLQVLTVGDNVRKRYVDRLKHVHEPIHPDGYAETPLAPWRPVDTDAC